VSALELRAKDGPLSTEELIARVVAWSQGMRSHVIGAVNRMQDINRGIHLLSMNARIEAARAGDAGAGFGVVAQELTRLSSNMRDAATSVVRDSQSTGVDIDALLQVLNEDVVASRLCDLAFNAIDIVDRNLYERSCDVRWWATEPAAAQCLIDDRPETRALASRRLGQILDSYTVYTDLVVADARGQVIVNGRPARYDSVGSQVNDGEWFRSAMATRSGNEFGFESVHASSLVGGQSTLVYSCAVRHPDVPARPLGVLGILFNWNSLGQTVLSQIPLTEAERPRTRACLVDGSGRILADTAPQQGTQTLDFPQRATLFAEQRGVVTTTLAGRRVKICHAASQGFETYRTGWHALLVRDEDT
jgi:hypothetical protein